MLGQDWKYVVAKTVEESHALQKAFQGMGFITRFGRDDLRPGLFIALKADMSMAIDTKDWGYDGVGLSDVVDFVASKQQTRTVKLNRDYSAVISKDGVKVGCQHFPLEAIDSLYDAYQSLDS